MKKRLFRNLLMLCLLVAALTVITLTVMASKPADYSMRFYGDTLPKENPPVTEINMNATFYCQKCNKTTALTPSSIITLTGIQFPVDNDHHKMALTGSISTVTCSSCNNSIGPINFNVTFAAQNGYFCHTGAYYELLEASGSQTIGSDRITFVIGTTPNYTLEQCSPRDATCAKVGIQAGVNCKHCDGCGKYFDPAGMEIAASQVEIEKTAHDYDPVTGLCKNNCGSKAAASLNGELKDSFEAAVEAYNNVNGGTLRVFTTPTGESFTLKKSGKLIVTSGVTLPNIILEGNPNVTIENAGTINAIKMGESSALTINNSGTVGSVEMDKPGTLTIENSGKITSIKTPARMTGTGTRTLNITNGSSGVIDEINAPNTTITVRNDGTIGLLRGYFPSEDKDPFRENMVTLQRGAGVYNKIHSVAPWTGDDGYTPKTADFSKLLSAGDYFYLPGMETPWQRGETYKDDDIIGIITLQNAYFTGLPIASIDVTGTADGVQVNPTAEEDGRLSMTVKAGQTVTLTGGVTLPDQGLKSDKAKLAYSWTCNAPGGSGSGNVFTFEDILYGEYDLTLTVQDNEYNHTKSVNIHINAEKPAGEKIELFFRIPSSGGVFTKSYDGTTAKPKPPHEVEIEFYVKNNSDVERTILVPSDCYKPTITYASPNCSADNPITVTVALTETGAENYTLGTNNTATITVDGEITQAAPIYTISQAATAHVGDSVFQRLTFAGFWYGRDTKRQPLFTPVTPGTTIMVEDEPLSVTFYRLHPSNITHRTEHGEITEFTHDPSMNEELTTDSTFTAVGEYYVYAVVQPTRNFEGVEKTFCCVINVQNTEASSEHHTDYTGWDGTFTASNPIAANDTKSVYLSSSLPTIYTELLLGQGKKLTLCLNGKTLSATNGVTSYNHIRVTDSAALTIDDCIGTGTVKGAAANGGWGGIAYVKDGTLTIKAGKFTGGTAKTGGGAIVVDEGGELNIFGGEISGNTVTDGNGGAIYIKSGGTVTITDGKITGNHVTSGNGGAIYVEKGGTLNLRGGEITGNTASGLGGGIYVEAGGTLNIKGNPVVTGNTAGGKDSNVYLCADSTKPLLTISGTMTSGAKLGISTDAKYPALLALTQQDLSAYFTPDAPDTFVIFSGDALTLCAKPMATLNGDTLTVSTDGNYKDGTVLLFVAEYSADGRLLTAQSKEVKLGIPDYTFTVSSSKIKCFLLNAQTHTPLMEAFVFN